MSGCSTHDGVFRVVFIEVDTAYEHGCIGGRCRDNDLFGTTLQMLTSSMEVTTLMFE